MIKARGSLINALQWFNLQLHPLAPALTLGAVTLFLGAGDGEAGAGHKHWWWDKTKFMWPGSYDKVHVTKFMWLGSCDQVHVIGLLQSV